MADLPAELKFRDPQRARALSEAIHREVKAVGRAPVPIWSRFRQVGREAALDADEKDVAQDRESPGTARGYEPVLWAVKRLEPRVKPVSAHELLLRVRLRLRSRATLSRWLAEVEGEVKSHGQDFGRHVGEARALLAQAGQNLTAARRCFELLKSVHESG